MPEPQCHTLVTSHVMLTTVMLMSSCVGAGLQLLVSASNSAHYLYNAGTPQAGPQACFTGHRTGSFFVRTAFSPEGDHVLSGCTDGQPCIWPVSLSGSEQQGRTWTLISVGAWPMHVMTPLSLRPQIIAWGRACNELQGGPMLRVCSSCSLLACRQAI